ncbi:hypothetical protein MFIFM68171_04581 [Madurella fahalii]|uniref:Uncharacterized protein n=1 Tax=Madurella fahalii TaxID=1157608 RepID=A0ABQ0G9B8_9PEZI
MRLAAGYPTEENSAGCVDAISIEVGSRSVEIDTCAWMMRFRGGFRRHGVKPRGRHEGIEICVCGEDRETWSGRAVCCASDPNHAVQGSGSGVGRGTGYDDPWAASISVGYSSLAFLERGPVGRFSAGIRCQKVGSDRADACLRLATEIYGGEDGDLDARENPSLSSGMGTCDDGVQGRDAARSGEQNRENDHGDCVNDWMAGPDGERGDRDSGSGRGDDTGRLAVMSRPTGRVENDDSKEVAAAEDGLWSGDASGLALWLVRKTDSQKQRRARQIYVK